LRAQIDLTDGMRKISCPLTLVAGEVSDLCTPAEIAGLAALHEKMRLHVCKGAGHVPPLCDSESQQFILAHIEAATAQ
jgi:hypothetical protein